MKKSLILLLVLFTSLFIFANGSNENAPAQSKGPEPVKEIVIWRPQNTAPIEAWWTEMLDNFNRKYEGKYTAKQQTFPKGGAQGYEDKINTAVIANNLPDLILVDGPAVASYAEADIIVPIDGLVSQESKDDLLDSTLAQGSYNGKLYTMPLWESSVGIYYNIEMLREAGIEAPKTADKAWTWDEFLEVAQKLSTPDRFGVTMHTNSGQITYYYSPMLVQNGTDLINPEGSQTAGYLDSPKTVEFLNWLKKLYDTKAANIEPSPTEFFDGKSAMLFSTCYQISNLQTKYPDFKYGVTYYPVSNDRKAGTPTGSWTVGMTKNAADKEAAMALLDWMTNTEANMTGCPASGYLPPRKSSMAALTQYNDEPYRIFMEQLANCGVPRPRTPVWTVLNPTFNTLVKDVLTGSDPASKLRDAVKKIDDDYKMNYAK